MKKAIAITTYSRLDCFQRCLESLKSNSDFGDWDLLVYPDLSTPEEFESLLKMSGFSLFSYPDQRLYGCGNILRSFRSSFDIGYDMVLRLDSDIQVSPYYLRQMMAAHAFCELPVQSNIGCKFTIEEKQVYSRYVWPGCHTGCNLLMTRQHWEAIQPYVEVYAAKYLTNPYTRDNDEALKWFKKHAHKIPAPTIPSSLPQCERADFENGKVGTGADSIISFSLLCHNLKVAATVVNRCVHASDTGENMTSGQYEFFKDVRLDILATDAIATDFHWL